MNIVLELGYKTPRGERCIILYKDLSIEMLLPCKQFGINQDAWLRCDEIAREVTLRRQQYVDRDKLYPVLVRPKDPEYLELNGILESDTRQEEFYEFEFDARNRLNGLRRFQYNEVTIIEEDDPLLLK